MTVYMVDSLPKLPYTHRIYMVLANPRHTCQERERTADFEGVSCVDRAQHQPTPPISHTRLA
jgi:hypothetical protein